MQNTIITYSEGRSNLGKVQNKEKSWANFKKMLSVPSRTKESFKEYSKLSVSQKREKKRADGYFCAALCKGGSRRKENIGDRIILTLDLDENADDVLASYLDGTNPICQVESFIQTSRSHSPKHPKFRMVILLDRPIDKEEHNALSRIVASKVDPTMRSMDPVSHRMAQMMFKPTAARDGKFIFKDYETGKALNVDKVFAAFVKKVGDWKNVANLPKNPEREDTLRDVMAKAEDPWAKDGPVGTWCRAWPIEELIAEHLHEYYFPSDDETGSEPRYTPVGSSGSSGVVVYEDGRFIYSNHTTDPIAEMNVNAWDLFRYCKFAHLDEGKTDTDTPMNKMPSWKAMMDFARKEPRYKEQAIGDRYVDVEDMLGGDDVSDADEEIEESKAVEDGNDSYPVVGKSANKSNKNNKKAKADKAPDGWRTKLATDKENKFKATLANVTQIIQNDPRTRGKLAYNEFTHEPCLTGMIKTAVDYIPNFICENPQKGDPLSDKIDDTLRALLSVPENYDLNVTDRDLKSGVMLASLKEPFHPIRDLTDQYADEWDGVERMETVPARYLGCEDSPYTREVFSNSMVALVGRQREPGLNFHNIIILQAPVGGEGKSEFCKIMGLREYYTDMSVDLTDAAKVVEAMKGNIVIELGELESLNKSTHEQMLSFLSSQGEQVRVAYAKRPEVYKRQSIVIGTTNRDAYLRAVGGNRRYWPLMVKKTPEDKIDKDAWEKEYPQVLGEAVHRYRKMREAKPKGDLNLNLRSPEAIATQRVLVSSVTKETPASEMAGQVDAWISRPVSYGELTWSYMGERDEFANEPDSDARRVMRTRVSSLEVKREFLEPHQITNHAANHVVNEALGAANTLERFKKMRFGKPSLASSLPVSMAFVSKLGNWTEKELTQGYAEITSPSLLIEIEVSRKDVPDNNTHDDLI